MTARGVAGLPICRDDHDRSHFLALLGGLVGRLDWSCGAFCLMTTHYHIVVRTPEGDLARGMQWLNGCYGQDFNRRHGGQGHVFHRRYHSVLIERDAHLLELCRYLALNPVRAGLCRRPEEWSWSSYPALLGAVPAPAYLAVGWLLELFGHRPATARSRLRAFIEDSFEQA